MAPDVSEPVLAVFTKVPEPGRVKTRLIPAMGAQGACRLHQWLLARALRAAVASGYRELQLWLAGDCVRGCWAEPLPAPVQLRRQTGAGLGERMAAAVAANFAGGAAAVIVAGSDCPALDAAHYRQVAAALARVDVVLIPALDGGYVSIGVRRFDPHLFEAIDWGGPRVLQQTLARVHALGWTHACLEALADIDRPEDLLLLRAFDDPALRELLGEE